MNGPRYLVWVNTRQFYCCATLTEAADWRRETGGVIYEPLGLTAAERIVALGDGPGVVVYEEDGDDDLPDTDTLPPTPTTDADGRPIPL